MTSNGSPRLPMLRMRGAIRSYAWGSRSAIAELLGVAAPTAEPQAELWLGAHPQNPAQVAVDGDWRRLDELVRHAPGEVLGPDLAAAAGDSPSLPFLLKVLAAERPLSIQTHPDRDQAEGGFRREEAAGVGRDDRRRNYRDPHPKPEILYALTPFVALSGFREPRQAHTDLAALGLGDRLPGLAALARDGAAGFRDLLRDGPAIGSPEARELVSRACAGLDRTSLGSAAAGRWLRLLADEHPADPAVLAPLFLNLVELQPGEALFTGAGVLHAYLRGLGLELMTSSDNVLRGGLTAKHVDRDELLRVVRFAEQPPARLARQALSEGGTGFLAPDADLGLAHLRFDGGPGLAFPGRGAEILLCTDGHVVAHLLGDGDDGLEGSRLELARGDAVFVPASAGRYRLMGKGEIFRGGHGLPLPRPAMDAGAAAVV